VLFDDDELHLKTAEDVLALNGGGDWHMAYLLMYKAVTVPEGAVPAAAAAAAVPKADGAAEGQPEPMKAD
jgi:ubiquitin carboxyl-terminal hydrolase 14